MRLSQQFVKPTKSVPADIQATSHHLLYQGGFIRQVAAGRYAYMPLGYRVWQKVIAVIDEEMTKLGSQRIHTPTLHPIEIWQKTNRDKAFGKEMLTVLDHHGASFALGATAEGLMTELVGRSKPSYKDLPIVIHQFSQKFRDEKRPRGGLLRVREFMMKDAYSFHATEQDLLVWYEKFKQAYLNLAQRFELAVVPVEAYSGALGGDFNHEFMVLAASGEDTIAVCDQTNYAANLETAVSEYESYPQAKELKELAEFKHDTAITCEELAVAMGIPIEVTTKTILFKAEERYVAALIRGDYEINETKLVRHLGVNELRLCTPEEVKELTGAEIGFAGPVGLPPQVQVMADLTCQHRVNFEAGSNKTGIHLYNLNFDRDFPTPPFVDIRMVKEGDTVFGGQGKIVLKKAIEWAHIFHQAQFYSTPHEAYYVAEDGEQQTLWQGAYGIGVGRTIATIVETHHDDNGIIWPAAVAPYQVNLLTLGNEAEVLKLAEQIYLTAEKEGVEILFDDRDISPGVKLKDADLLGVPLRYIISSRSLAAGGVEVSRRCEDKREIVPVAKLADIFKTLYTKA